MNRGIPILLLILVLGVTGCALEKNVPIYEHFYAPDSFSPNGDNWNEQFLIVKPDYVQLSKFHISIYTGSVQLIFEANSINTGWDGKINGEPAPTGFYDYQIVYTVATDSINYDDYVTSSRINLFR